MRHQRDLFTGSSLGIPDVNTHVGSVIHAFETMAIERNLQQATDNLVRQKTQPGPSSTGSGSGGKKIILPSVPPTTTTTKTEGKSHLKSREIVHDPVYGHIPQQFHEFYIEKSVDDTTTETSSNLDGASYIIDDNYRKSGFGAKPTNPIACQTNNSRIPTMIMSKKQQNNNNNNYEIVKNITVQSNTSSHNNSNNAKSHRPKILQTTTDSIHFNINKDRQKHQSAAVEEQFENYEQDFIRGSTVSQSFIKNVKGSSSGGNRKTTYEKNVYQVTKNPVVDVNRHAAASTPSRSSVNRNERKLKAKSMGVDELSERYTRHTGDGSSGSRTRARSNERRKTTYAPNSLDRAEL